MDQDFDFADGETVSLYEAGSENMKVALSAHRGVRLLTPVPFQTLSWAEVMNLRGPGELVWRVANSLGWATALPDRPDNPASMTFTVIAQLFASQLLDSSDWYIRGVDASSDGQRPDVLQMLRGFPTGVQSYVRSFEDAATGTQSRPLRSGLWALYRDAETVLVFDEQAAIHTRDHRVSIDDLISSWGQDLVTIARKCLEISVPT